MTDEIPDDVPTEYLGSYAAALKSGNVEQINQLSKGEAYFYLCKKLGVDPDAEHPDSFNGTITTEKVRELAIAATEEDS